MAVGGNRCGGPRRGASLPSSSGSNRRTSSSNCAASGRFSKLIDSIALISSSRETTPSSSKSSVLNAWPIDPSVSAISAFSFSTIEEIRESSRRVDSPPSNIDASFASSSSSRLSACRGMDGEKEVRWWWWQ